MFKWRKLYARYINLHHRADRRELMEVELNRVGIKADRFEAIFTKGNEWNRFPYQMMFNRTRGAIGCMLSQMEVMKEAKELGVGVMVLEDDLTVGSDATERLDYIEKYVNEKEPDFDIFFLGGTVHCNRSWWHSTPHYGELTTCNCTLNRDGELTDDPRIIRTYGMFSTHAYIVNVKSIEKILKLLNSFIHLSIGIDHALINFQPQLRCFAFMPGIVKQYNAVSDIGQGVTYFENFSKLNGSIENSAYWWQDKMTDFDPTTFNWGEFKNHL